jgi:methionine-rich copper-binding protein CopC
MGHGEAQNISEVRWSRGIGLVVGATFPPLLFAHAILVKSEPGQGATVPESPGKIELWFNEGVGKDYTALAVIDGNGARVDNRDARLGWFDRSYLRVTLPPLSPGTYTVRYRVQSADGHIVSGKFNFSVQDQ